MRWLRTGEDGSGDVSADGRLAVLADDVADGRPIPDGVYVAGTYGKKTFPRDIVRVLDLRTGRSTRIEFARDPDLPGGRAGQSE